MIWLLSFLELTLAVAQIGSLYQSKNVGQFKTPPSFPNERSKDSFLWLRGNVVHLWCWRDELTWEEEGAWIKYYFWSILLQNCPHKVQPILECWLQCECHLKLFISLYASVCNEFFHLLSRATGNFLNSNIENAFYFTHPNINDAKFAYILHDIRPYKPFWNGLKIAIGLFPSDVSKRLSADPKLAVTK